MSEPGYDPTAKIAVIYYSATGNVHVLAEAVADGARQAGAEVRLLRVPELVTADVIASRPQWQAHLEAAAHLPVASHADLEWADGVALGTPARFGNVCSQLKHFLDGAGSLWFAGKLQGKCGTAFTSADTLHGGLEATVLSIYHSLFHWGAIVVAPGYTQPDAPGGGETPYGTAHRSADGPPDAGHLSAARHQGARLAHYAAILKSAATR